MSSIAESSAPWRRPKRVIHQWSRIMSVIFLGTVLLGGLGLWLSPTEPTYEGREISEWVHDAARLGKLTGQDAAWDQQILKSHQAIRAIGTNGVPTMLRLLHTRDSRLKVMANQLLKKQSLTQFHFLDAFQFHMRALTGFSILGTNAASAWPALQQDLKSDNGGTRNLALVALGRITNSPPEWRMGYSPTLPTPSQ